MVPESMLGRYEFIGTNAQGGDGRKFWWIMLNRDTQTYTVSYGRIGNRPQHHEYSAKDAVTKIKEKVKKGYNHREGYETAIGSNAIHYIQSFLEDEAA